MRPTPIRACACMKATPVASGPVTTAGKRGRYSMKLFSTSNPWKFTVVVMVVATSLWTHLPVQETNTELVQHCLPDDDSFDTQDIYCEHTPRSEGSPPRSSREFIFDGQNELSMTSKTPERRAI